MGDGLNPVLTADLETVQRRDLHSAESRDFLSWTLRCGTKTGRFHQLDVLLTTWKMYHNLKQLILDHLTRFKSSRFSILEYAEHPFNLRSWL